MLVFMASFRWFEAEEHVRGMTVRGIRRKEFLVPITLTIIPLTRLCSSGNGGLAIPFGATKRAHWRIMERRVRSE